MLFLVFALLFAHLTLLPNACDRRKEPPVCGFYSGPFGWDTNSSWALGKLTLRPNRGRLQPCHHKQPFVRLALTPWEAPVQPPLANRGASGGDTDPLQGHPKREPLTCCFFSRHLPFQPAKALLLQGLCFMEGFCGGGTEGLPRITEEV